VNEFQFTAAAVISYLGLAAGFFLASLTKEELLTGKKFFPWIQRIIGFAIVAVALQGTNKLVQFGVLLAFALLVLVTYRINLPLLYGIFGVSVFMVSNDPPALSVALSLVFLFGLVSGSEKFVRVNFPKHVALLLACNLTFFVAVLLNFFY
jgi:hypothetical protein